jgi:hypothetical protein
MAGFREAWGGSMTSQIMARSQSQLKRHINTNTDNQLWQQHQHRHKSSPAYTITMASTTAQRRLLQEYRALTNNPPEGITAGPVSEDDLLYWEALIQGPEGTPFEGGVFPAELKFPKDYPLAPPSMRFLGEVWHPNGTVCPFYEFARDIIMEGR